MELTYTQVVEEPERIFCESSNALALPNKGNILPPWFVSALRQYQFPSWVLRIPFFHEIVYFPQVEAEDQTYSLLAAMDIVKAFAAIVLSNDYPKISLESTLSKVIDVILEIRVGSELKEMTISFSESDVVSLPNLKDMPDLPTGIRKQFLHQVLKLNDNDLEVVAQFPDEVQIFMCSIIYCYCRANQASFKIHGLVLMVVLLKIIETSYTNTEDNIERKRLTISSEESIENNPSSNIKDLWNNIDIEDCISAFKILPELHRFQLDIVTKGQGKGYILSESQSPSTYNIKIVHNYSEFQMVLFFTMYLNRLLLCPYEDTNSILYFNSSLLYSLTSHITANERWLDGLLGCKSLHKLLQKVDNLFSLLKQDKHGNPTPQQVKEEGAYPIVDDPGSDEIDVITDTIAYI